MANNNEYPMNEKLLEETIHLIERFRMVKDRFEKVEEYKTQVSRPVFEKVRHDYTERLEQATADLLAKKVEVDSELDVMQQSFNKAAKQLEEQRHALEELDLRYKLGEFSDTEYKSTTSDLRDKVEKLGEIVASIEEAMNRYRALFDDIDLSGTKNIREQKHKEHVSYKPIEKIDIEGTKDLIIEDTAEFDKATKEEESEEINTEIEPESKFDDELGFDTSSDIKSMKNKADVSARLVVIAGDDSGSSYPLTGTTSIGRAESSSIRINDSRVSRQHSRIQKHGEEYIIIDLHSSNGTFVNGQKIDEYVLAPGDEIQIGDTVLQFQS